MHRRASRLALLALGVLAPAEARAMGAAVGKAGEAVEVGSARIAVAAADGRTTRWAQVSVVGASQGFVWLVPVRAGARIDLASDAWLDALDAATAPVVLPPTAPDSCDVGGAPDRIATASSPAAATPLQAGLFTDASTLTAFVTGAGYAIPAGLSGPIAAVLGAGGAVLALTYAESPLPTRTVRIVDDGPPTLPLTFTGGGAESRITAFALGAAGASAGAAPLALDPSAILWEGNGQSTYVAERDALLAQWQGARWLTASALPDLLFDGVPVGAGAAPLPPVLARYFALATSGGDAGADPAACAAAADATRTNATPFAAECPAGALGIAPGPTPCAPTGDGGASSEAMRCGAADDAVFALAALSPADVWVTRIEGIVTAASAQEVPLTVTAGAPSSPVVTAAAYASTCEPAPPPPSSSPSPAPAPTPSPSPPQGSDSSGSDVAPAVAEGCGAALADSCSSSDSSSEDGGSGGCGSSSDPPSDGSSSSGSCGSGSGSSDPSSSNCATASRPRGRSPFSRVLLACAAAAAVARRRRPRRRAG